MIQRHNRLYEEIGEYEVCSPVIPAKSTFINADVKITRHQKFVRTVLPDAFHKKKGTQTEDDIAEMTAFIVQEWERRTNGVWFWNCGQATYLTGTHYFYLCYNPIDTGYPDYREADRRFFWLWKYCEDDPLCFGLLYITRRQQGKCMAPGTLVRMYDGTLKPIEHILVGEQVMGVDSTPRNVLSTHAGQDEMYEVVQNRGMAYTVNSEHLVSLRRNKSTTCSEVVQGVRKYYQSYPQYDSVANIPAKELIGKSAKFFSQFSGYATGYELPERRVTIDPYFLGTWLGDGSSKVVGITTIDAETRDYVYEVARGYGLTVNVNQNSNKRCPTYIITTGQVGSRKNTLRNQFAAYNLFDNKHVPADYLQNSREIRLQVLAGLIDTDGYTNVGCYCITQKNKQLADDIYQLAVSLGFRVVRSTIKKQIRKIGFEGTYYKLTIIGAVDEIPVRLPRKKIILNATKDKQLTRINEIRPVGRGQYHGFSLDGDHLFLLEDGTVTHNSYKLGCILLEFVTREERVHCGVQSKSDGDAQKFFERAVVRAWKKLPYFFSPKYRNPNPPKKALEFYAPASNSKIAKATDGSVSQDAELESLLDFQPSQEEAYDGSKLARYGRDEAFKEQVPDPLKAVSIVKRTMEQPIPGKGIQIIGKILVTSTIQEIEGKGVARARSAWDDADPSQRDGNGHTSSGLYRYFQPVWEGHEIDEYGRDKAEESRRYFQNRRDEFKRTGQEAKHEAEVRANPFDIDEALEGRQTECMFNALHLGHNLGTAKKLLPAQKPQLYDLVFNRDRTKVRAVHNPVNGKFLLSWLPPEGMTNRVSTAGTLNTKTGPVTKYRPKNDVQFAVGCDPYDKNVVTDNQRSSNAAAYAFAKWNPHMDARPDALGYYPSHSFFVEYINRPAAPSIFYNDMIALCHWLGCKLHFENQKSVIETHFEEAGYGEFLAERPKFTHTDNTKKQTAKGTPSSQLTKGFYSDLLIEFVHAYVGFDEDGNEMDWRHLPFERLMEDMKKFDLKKTQVHDPTVAAGFCLMSALQNTRPPADSKTTASVMAAVEDLYED